MEKVYTRQHAQKGLRKKGLGWGWEFGDPNGKKAANELSILAST